MRTIVSWALAAWMGTLPAMAVKPKPPTAAQLQAQIKKLIKERDELSERLAATDSLQQDLVSAQKSRDLARQEAEALGKELAGIKSSLSENQSGADAILKELQKAKTDLAACVAERTALKRDLEEAETKAKAQTQDLTGAGRPDLIPARALNLNRVAPKAKNVSRGVVVVDVLVNESGEVIDTRLVQGLPGNDADVKKANEACLESAKRIVFDPARSSDGKTKLRVWQPVGFLVE